MSAISASPTPAARSGEIADNFSVRSAPAVLGYGSAMAVILSAFQFTGGRLQGYKRDPEIDEVARKEHMRKNRRRPIDETVHQLGEGRGEFEMKRSLRSVCESGPETLTHNLQVFMRQGTRSGERRGSRRRMESMFQVQEWSRVMHWNDHGRRLCL